MERSTSSDTNVIDMINDWREETLDLDELLHPASSASANQRINNARNSMARTSSAMAANTTADSMVSDNGVILPAYPSKVTIPTFSSANRPSILDLSTTIKYQDRPRMLNNVNGSNNSHQQQRSVSPHQPVQSPHSPHHSPYMTNPAQQVFTYNNSEQQQQQHSPVSPHAPRGNMMHSPVSPHAQHIDQGPVSPHHMRGGSVSPVPMQPQPPPLSPHSPYAASNRGMVSPMSPHSHHSGMVSPGPCSPHQQMQPSGAMSPHHPGMGVGGGPLPGSMSPHHRSHSGSVSPVARQLSPTPGASSVFGRYAGSPVSMHSGNSSDTDSYYSMGKRGMGSEKGSEMYKAKRERNNIAVRKSREKKKQREMETERRVKELSEENAGLQSKLDIALKEMNLLKNLYKSIGVQLPPEAKAKLENELSKFT